MGTRSNRRMLGHNAPPRSSYSLSSKNDSYTSLNGVLRLMLFGNMNQVTTITGMGKFLYLISFRRGAPTFPSEFMAKITSPSHWESIKQISPPSWGSYVHARLIVVWANHSSEMRFLSLKPDMDNRSCFYCTLIDEGETETEKKNSSKNQTLISFHSSVPKPVELK